MVAKAQPTAEFVTMMTAMGDLPGSQAMALHSARRLLSKVAATITLMKDLGADPRRITALTICHDLWLRLAERLYTMPYHDDDCDHAAWLLSTALISVNDATISLIALDLDHIPNPIQPFAPDMFVPNGKDIVRLDDQERLSMFGDYVAYLEHGLTESQPGFAVQVVELAQTWLTVYLEAGEFDERSCLLDVAADQLSKYEAMLAVPRPRGGTAC